MYSARLPRVEGDDKAFASTEAWRVYDDQNLQGDVKAIHLVLSKITKQRQKDTSLIKKTKWAFFNRKTFDDTIANLNYLINALENTIPSFAPVLQGIVRIEVEEIRKQDSQKSDGLELLQDVNARKDGRFDEAATKAVRGTYSHTWVETTASDDVTLQQGNNFALGFTMGHVATGPLGSHSVWGDKGYGARTRAPRRSVEVPTSGLSAQAIRPAIPMDWHSAH